MSTRLPRFPSLKEKLAVDVVVVGGGITGITAAYLLKRTGRTVALIERDRCAQADTGHTTAHLTFVTDTRLSSLVKSFGREHAQAVWDAGWAGMRQIEENVATLKVPCRHSSVPGYLHASLKGQEDERSRLQEDAQLADELGFPAGYVESVPF